MAKNEMVQTWRARLEKALQEKNAFTDVLEKIEKKFNCPRLYIVGVVAVVVGLWLMVGYGAQFLCNFVGFLYPAYASIKAIESLQKDDDTKWLTYWVVYSAFSLLEFFTDIFLFWIPFYWFLKCVFLMCCMVPTSWNGSIMIYNRIIRPWFLKHHDKVDEALDKAADFAEDVIKEGEDALRDEASDMVKRHVDDSFKAD